VNIERDTTGRTPDDGGKGITAGQRNVTGETGVMPPDARLDREDPPEAIPGPKPKRHIGRYVLVVLMCFLLLLPFVPLIFWSISHRWFFPTIIPEQLSDRAWSYVFSDRSDVMEGLFNSLGIAVLVAVIAAAIGLSGGRALGLYRFRGKRFVELILLAPVIVPAIAVSMGIQVMFIRYGLSDTIAGVVLVHLIPTIPYVVLVMGAVFANYDTSYEEQARVLGANPLRVFLHVTFPAVLPGLIVAAFFAFLISWSEYIMTVLIGGGLVVTLPILLFQFVGSDPSIAAALSLFFIAPAIVLMVLTSRYLGGDQSAVGGIGRA
jgi:putative spermidine/putrescine transport system permease protein